MTPDYLTRLRAAIAPLGDWHDEPGNEWGQDYFGLHEGPSERVFTVRRLRYFAPLFRRIEAAGAAFTFDHALKRAYSTLRGLVAPLKTPLLDRMKQGTSSVNWGGNGVYWDVVTKS